MEIPGRKVTCYYTSFCPHSLLYSYLHIVTIAVDDSQVCVIGAVDRAVSLWDLCQLCLEGLHEGVKGQVGGPVGNQADLCVPLAAVCDNLSGKESLGTFPI